MEIKKIHISPSVSLNYIHTEEANTKKHKKEMISQMVKEIEQEEFKFWFLSQKNGAKEKSDEKQGQQGVKMKGSALKDLKGRKTVLKQSSLNSTRTRQRWQAGDLRLHLETILFTPSVTFII